MHIKKVDVNTNGRDFIVGDIHGFYDTLMSGLEFLKFDGSVDRLFSVGDLVDRGPKSFECLRLIDEPWFFAVAGNHEDMLIQSINHPEPAYMWINNGGFWAYDFWNDKFSDMHSEFFNHLADKAKALPWIIRIGDENVIIHAELVHHNINDLRSGLLGDDEKLMKCCGGDTIYGDTMVKWGRKLWSPVQGVNLDDPSNIHKLAKKMHRDGNYDNLPTVWSGHTVISRPCKWNNFINIDTGSFMQRNAKMGISIINMKTHDGILCRDDGITSQSILTIE